MVLCSGGAAWELCTGLMRLTNSESGNLIGEEFELLLAYHGIENSLRHSGSPRTFFWVNFFQFLSFSILGPHVLTRGIASNNNWEKVEKDGFDITEGDSRNLRNSFLPYWQFLLKNQWRTAWNKVRLYFEYAMNYWMLWTGRHCYISRECITYWII